ncbi:ANTAR domain-containing protein [Nocardioides alcanivorans]|uniref:ANTAR domain-containing protein n=1 Tax=Nocardioides alcanivorans TaxID=2897352 RepID=UPI001F200C93|nr:ANTAR domain-containing protein [Nocardioides alcanivorans]
MSDESSPEPFTRLEQWHPVAPDEFPNEVPATGGAEEVALLRSEVDHLRRALASQPTIDQAKGMLMARFRIDSEAAFAVLKRLSQDHNVKVRDIAGAMVAVISAKQIGTEPSRSKTARIAVDLLTRDPDQAQPTVGHHAFANQEP